MRKFRKHLYKYSQTYIGIVTTLKGFGHAILLAAATHWIMLIYAYQSGPQLPSYGEYKQNIAGLMTFLLLVCLLTPALCQLIYGRSLKVLWTSVVYLLFTGLFCSQYDKISYLGLLLIACVFTFNIASVFRNLVLEYLIIDYEAGDEYAIDRLMVKETKTDESIRYVVFDPITGANAEYIESTEVPIGSAVFDGPSQLEADEDVLHTLEVKYGSAEPISSDELEKVMNTVEQSPELEEVVDTTHIESDENGVDTHKESDENGVDTHKESDEQVDTTHIESDENGVDTHKESDENGVDTHNESDEQVVDTTYKESDDNVIDTHKESDEQVVGATYKESDDNVIDTHKESDEQVVDTTIKESDEPVVETYKESDEQVVDTTHIESDENVVDTHKESDGQVVDTTHKESDEQVDESVNTRPLDEEYQRLMAVYKRISKHKENQHRRR